jgi:hypothetical protein
VACFSDESIPAIKAGIDDGFLVVEDPKGKEALAQSPGGRYGPML